MGRYTTSLISKGATYRIYLEGSRELWENPDQNSITQQKSIKFIRTIQMDTNN